MKRILKKMLLASVAIMMAFTGATAQVDLQQSFGIMCDSEDDFMFAEGGNWKITFATTDTLGNEYDGPVRIMVNGALYPDTMKYDMAKVDSLLFKLPETQFAAGVFEIGEELFQYIVDSDSASTIYFRIDCITKTKVPKVGQKVICNIYRDKLPYGFMGRVENMYLDYNRGVVVMQCSTLALEDVYDVLYTGGVSRDGETEEMPDSIVEKKIVVKRLNTRADGDSQIESGKEEKEHEINIVFSVKEDGKFVIGSEGPLVVKITGKSFFDACCSTIIDKAQGISRTECYVDAVLDGKITVEGSFGYKPKEEIEKNWVKIPIPIPVLPGLSINIDLGVTYDFFVGMQATLEGGFKIGRKVGFILQGSDKDVIWEEHVYDDPREKFSTGLYGSDAFAVKGEFMIVPHVKVGIGLLGQGVKFQLKFGAGMKISAQASVEGGQLDYALEDDPEWLYEREELYKKMNDGTFLKLESVLLFDLVFTVLNDGWSLKVSDWMSLFGLDNKMYYPWYEVGAVPNTTKFEEKHFTGGVYKGILKSDYKHLFKYDASIMFVDNSPGAPLDHNPDYVKSVGLFDNFTSDNKIEFGIDLNGLDQLKGRLIGVYPVIYNSFYTGNLVMGKFDEIYIPYKVKMTRNDKDYERAEIEAEFEVHALDNPNITEGGFIFLDPETNNVIKPVVIFDKAHPGSNVMKMTVERGEFPRDEFNVQAYIIDSANDQYVYSTTWPGGFFEYYAPTTEDATDITAVGATLNANLHSSIYEAEDMNHMDNRFSVGFAYYPDAKMPMDYLNNVRKVGYEYNLDGLLKPDTEYMFNAVVQDHETGKTYKGLTVKFRTKPVFSDLEAKASYTKVLFFAKVDKGFMGVSNENRYKFLVADSKDFIDMGDEIAVSPEDIGRDSDEDDFEIILETDNKWDRDRQYYFKVVYDDGKGNRHESSVMPFSVPPPIDNLAAKPEAELAELSADVQGEYALGKVKTTIQYSTTENDFDENAEEIDITKKIGWSSKEMDIYLLNYTLENLSTSTTYYYRYRLDLELDDGEVDYATPVHMFKTKKLDLMATTMSASVTKNRVSMAGSVTKPLKERLDASVQNEDEKLYMLFFEVSKNKDMAASAVCYVPMTEEREYSAELRNLAWNTKYYYRFVAMTANDRQLYRGAIKNFTIAEEPADNYDVETFDAVLDDEWTTLKGKVNSTVLEALEAGIYGEMLFGFEYAPTKSDLENGTDNVLRDSDVALSKSTGLFTKSLQLKPNTQYYCRAFVYVAGRFVYGNIVDFKTADYDAGLIVPDLEAARRRELKALELDESLIKDVIFFEKGKMIVPTDKELKLLIETEPYEKINE